MFFGKRWKIRLAAACFLPVLFFAGAASCFAHSGGKSVSVMCWNMETFFDAVFDGNEYKEFSSSRSGWCESKYRVRLERAASVIKKIGCDVVVLEEMEKSGQLRDISNQLSATFSRKSVYRHGFFAAEEGASIGCGILSRYPILSARVHSIKVGGRKGRFQPSLRPILQVTLDVGGKKIDVFVNHWKSKSGNSAESEQWRDRQERQLAFLMGKSVSSGVPALACGDFNRSIEEFEKRDGDGSGPNVVLKGGLSVYSPWYGDDGKICAVGSYWYKGAWEYIDNFFSAGGISISDFAPCTAGEWADASFRPRRYRMHPGSGYSDHLPIACKVLIL